MSPARLIGSPSRRHRPWRDGVETSSIRLRKVWEVTPEKRDAVLARVALGPHSTSEVARSIWPGAPAGAAAHVCRKLAKDGLIRRLPFPDCRWVSKDYVAVLHTPTPNVKPSLRKKEKPPATSWWTNVPRDAWAGAVAARHVERSNAFQPRPIE